VFRVSDDGEPIASIILFFIRSFIQMTEPEVQTVNVIIAVLGTETSANGKINSKLQTLLKIRLSLFKENSNGQRIHIGI
jgi:hypothetical protein